MYSASCLAKPLATVQQFVDRRGGHGGVEVEAEVADVGAALGVDHHVVAVERGEPAQLGVGGERAVGLPPQEPAVGHGDHEQAPVGQPPQARRLPGHLDLVNTGCAHFTGTPKITVNGGPLPPEVLMGLMMAM